MSSNYVLRETRINGEDILYGFTPYDEVHVVCWDCEYPDNQCFMTKDEFNKWNGKCAYNSNR